MTADEIQKEKNRAIRNNFEELRKRKLEIAKSYLCSAAESQSHEEFVKYADKAEGCISDSVQLHQEVQNIIDEEKNVTVKS